MARLCERTDGFHRGTDNAQHATVRVHLGQIALLNGAQCLGRSRVAGQYHQMTTAIEECFDGLQGVLIDHFKRVTAVRSTRIVAQINVIVVGHILAYLTQNGESAVTGVEHTDGARGLRQSGSDFGIKFFCHAFRVLWPLVFQE